jgi:hypothetical protein
MMLAIINHLPIKSDTDWGVLARKVDEFNALVDHPDYRGTSLIRVRDDAATLVVLFTSQEALDKVSREVAGPWFAENMRSYLSGAGDRHVGEVVAGPLAQDAQGNSQATVRVG